MGHSLVNFNRNTEWVAIEWIIIDAFTRGLDKINKNVMNIGLNIWNKDKSHIKTKSWKTVDNVGNSVPLPGALEGSCHSCSFHSILKFLTHHLGIVSTKQ